MNTYRKGFTLIEMLIVITIIGILASLILVGLGSARTAARDAKRISDLRQIRTALELYYQAHGQYPTVAAWVNSAAGCSWIPGLVPTYFDCLPQDPYNTGGWPWDPAVTGLEYAYGYPQGGFPQVYDLVAHLEDPNNPNRCGAHTYYYHTAGGSSWCGPYSPQLYADH